MVPFSSVQRPPKSHRQIRLCRKPHSVARQVMKTRRVSVDMQSKANEEITSRNPHSWGHTRILEQADTRRKQQNSKPENRIHQLQPVGLDDTYEKAQFRKSAVSGKGTDELTPREFQNVSADDAHHTCNPARTFQIPRQGDVSCRTSLHTSIHGTEARTHVNAC